MPANSDSLRNREEEAERMNYAAVRLYVENAVGRDLLNEWKEFVIADPRAKKLWGQEQVSSFNRRMVTLAIYKDLTGDGYQKILNQIELGFKMTAKCYLRNTKLIRKILAAWGEQQIVNEGAAKWDQHKKLFPKKRNLGSVNLIMDSTDFKLSGKASMSRKDPRWSYKLNAPGQRFQVVCDARGKVQRLWGGYSPKVYDGDWVDVMKEELAATLKGGHIVADTHYETANATLKKIGKQKHVVFYTPYAKPRGRKPKTTDGVSQDQSRGLRVLTTEQKEWNKRIQHIRARVESPFGLIKNKWKGLGGTFYEDEDQQNYLVLLAIGAHNYKIEHP